MTRRYVLSLDGGGVRTIFTLALLRAIQAEHVHLNEQFDLVVATSGGALAAATIVTGRESLLSDLLNEPNISQLFFQKSLWDRVMPIQAEPKYDGHTLKDAVQRFLKGTEFHHAHVPLVVPTFDINRRIPVILRSYEHATCHHSMTTIMSAATAAPIYFPATPFTCCNRTSLLIDGGVAANNPAQLAFVEARRLFPQEDDLYLLSIGTGRGQLAKPVSDASWGLPQWVHHGLLDMLMSAPAVMAHDMMHALATTLPQFHYMRLDSDLPTIEIDDDTLETQSALMAEAERVFQKQRCEITQFLRVTDFQK